MEEYLLTEEGEEEDFFPIKDKWTPINEVDFSDATINQYHIDTRDFHCSTSTKIRPNKYRKVRTCPDRYILKSEEVNEIVMRLYNESGGEFEWRMLTLIDEKGRTVYGNWGLKYLRIYRIENNNLIITDRHSQPITKADLGLKINPKYLAAHNINRKIKSNE